jgi:indoleamine 2,3-dioxygenase
MSNNSLTDSATTSRSVAVPETANRRRFPIGGFLPETDPLTAFPPDSELAILDEIGRDLPSLLHDRGFRKYARTLNIPPWPNNRAHPQDWPALRLYYVRVGFLASAYVNQVGEPPANTLPANLAVPLWRACQLLRRPPILSYDGYALYNWKRFRKDGPIALGNIDTNQNFVHLYDEHWFILVHVEIEAIAARILDAIARVEIALAKGDGGSIERYLWDIAGAIREQIGVLRKIPEHMDSTIYYRTFRPYIRFFENVSYEGIEPGAATSPMNYRGETGAQSSIMPTLVAFMKIPHKPSMLTDYLADMRNYMPFEHRMLIEQVEAMPVIRSLAGKEPFNATLEAIAEFRSIHYGWAQEYINRWTTDPRGTGGTPYMQWLDQLIHETRSFKIA